MVAPTLTIKDASGVVTNKGQLIVTFTILKDGAAVDLTGDTVVATVRKEDNPDTVIAAGLEDHATTITTAASGIGTLTLTSAEMELLATAAKRLTDVTQYLVSFKQVTAAYHPREMLRLFVKRVAD